MLKIQCPECEKRFLWTDDMPTRGKCPAADCNWQYDIHSELKRNIAQREAAAEQKTLNCPFCNGEIPSRFTICPNCGHIVFGAQSIRKKYFFLTVCLILILLPLIVKYLVE